MKRMAVLLLAISLLLCACVGGEMPTDSEPTTEPRTDLDVQMQYSSYAFSSIARSGDVLYACRNGAMQYYDFQSGISGYLCPDPSCTHDSDSCAAHINYGFTVPLFTCYDGHLYRLDNKASRDYRSLCLHRCDLDGRNHEIVKELDYEKWYETYSPQRWLLHRGKLFFLGARSEVDGTTASTRITVGYLPLDGEEETVLYSYAQPEAQTGNMFLRGDKLYYAAPEADALRIFCYDLLDNSSTTLLTDPSLADIFGLNFWVDENETVYVATGQDVCVVQNGALEKVFSFDTDATCAYLFDGIAVMLSIGEEKYSTVEIRSYDGTLIYSGKTFAHTVEGFDETLGTVTPIFCQAVIGGDADALIVMTSYDRFDMVDTFLLDLKNDMKVTHLWTGYTFE